MPGDTDAEVGCIYCICMLRGIVGLAAFGEYLTEVIGMPTYIIRTVAFPCNAHRTWKAGQTKSRTIQPIESA